MSGATGDPVGRMVRQMDAFHTVAVACDRCGRDTPLAYLHQVPPSRFMCDHCLVTMPHDEFVAIKDAAACLPPGGGGTTW